MSKGKKNMSQWTLRKFLLWWAEHRESGPLENNTRWAYLSVVNRICCCAGHEVLCREVNDAMLLRFRKWHKDSGYKEPTALTANESVKSLVRRWDPDRFPFDRTPSKAITFANTDLDGTLEKLFVDRFVPERPQLASESSIRLYGKTLYMFGVFLGHPATLGDLTDLTLGRFLRWLTTEKEKPNKNSTANMYLKRLKAIWNWAAKVRMLDTFPTIGKLPEPERVPVSYTREELKMLIEASGAFTGYLGRIPAGAFWKAFHMIIWDGGARPGEMLALRWEWLDVRRSFLLVPAEARKGKRKSATYKLKPETLEAIEVIRNPPREVIFAIPFKMAPSGGIPASFYDRYKEFVKFAGIRYVTRQTTPQQMRRSFASHLEAAGGNATRALRHADRRVTEQSYLDPRIADADQPSDRLFSLTE